MIVVARDAAPGAHAVEATEIRRLGR